MVYNKLRTGMKWNKNKIEDYNRDVKRRRNVTISYLLDKSCSKVGLSSSLGI